MRQQHPKALYVHFSTHSLNLVISSVRPIPTFKHYLGTLSQIRDLCGILPLRIQNLKERICNLLPDLQKQKMGRVPGFSYVFF
jgi:hypothetical protein